MINLVGPFQNYLSKGQNTMEEEWWLCFLCQGEKFGYTVALFNFILITLPHASMNHCFLSVTRAVIVCLCACVFVVIILMSLSDNQITGCRGSVTASFSSPALSTTFSQTQIKNIYWGNNKWMLKSGSLFPKDPPWTTSHTWPIFIFYLIYLVIFLIWRNIVLYHCWREGAHK